MHHYRKRRKTSFRSNKRGRRIVNGCNESRSQRSLTFNWSCFLFVIQDEKQRVVKVVIGDNYEILIFFINDTNATKSKIGKKDRNLCSLPFSVILRQMLKTPWLSTKI